MNNEAAKRLLDDLADALSERGYAFPGDEAPAPLKLVVAALAAERKATVERIRAAVAIAPRSDDYYCDGWLEDETLAAILDAEAAR